MQSSISRIFSRLPNDFIFTLACNLSDRRFCLSSYSINYLFAMAYYKVFPRKWMLIFLAEDLQKLNHEFVFRFRYWSVRPDNILLTFINTIFIKKISKYCHFALSFVFATDTRYVWHCDFNVIAAVKSITDSLLYHALCTLSWYSQE